MAFEVQNFAQDVLEASQQTPVVVDFWAPWCGPCQFLGPVIEKLAREADGQWQLVKVNSDEHPELSAQYRVQGIPAVKMFVEGRVAAEFTGALPEPAIRRWLAQHLPSASRKALQMAQQLIQAGQPEAAAQQLAQVLAQEPQNAQAAMALARLRLFDQPAQAAELLRLAERDGELLQTAEQLAHLAHLLAPGAGLPAGPGQATFQAGLAALATRDFGAALEAFIQVVATHRAYHEKAAEKACLGIFAYLGEGHEITKQYRRRFGMALY
ncbi:MAG: tetratricopeptide repeat protein [Bernardetiaceae bacterium]|jgi:putative thioredoxin|nr:tetratricopeptide repeat protein [Bernardetiaceae bacterium]